jgi:hypothetical protein
VEQNQLVSSITVWLIYLLLGWSDACFGKIGLQILFYMTIGGLGIWVFIRLFTISSAIESCNFKIKLYNNRS